MFRSVSSVSTFSSYDPTGTITPFARNSVYSTVSSISSRRSSVNSISPPSLLVQLAKKWTEPHTPTTPAKKFKSVRIQGNRDSIKIQEVARRCIWKLSVPSDTTLEDLVNSTISMLEVTGITSRPVIKIIAQAAKVDAIHFNQCYFNCSAHEFSFLIRSISATSLTFTGCEFLDVSMIGDGLFLRNEQIQRVVIVPPNMKGYRFPSLTNATLFLWKRTVPAQVHFTNVQTSFTAQALVGVAKCLTRHHRFSWNLGKICSEAFEVPQLFSELSAKHVKKVVFIFDQFIVTYKHKNVLIFKCNTSNRLVTPIELIV